MKCAYKIKQGSSCGANAMKKSEHCFTHNTASKQRHLEAASKGGLLSRGTRGIKLDDLPLDSPKSVVVLLQDTINRVRIVHVEDGTMETTTATTIGYLCSQLIRTLEVAEFEERINEIEKTVFNKSK